MKGRKDEWITDKQKERICYLIISGGYRVNDIAGTYHKSPEWIRKIVRHHRAAAKELATATE